MIPRQRWLRIPYWELVSGSCLGIKNSEPTSLEDCGNLLGEKRELKGRSSSLCFWGM